MTAKPDWERIELLYRAGLLSVREIASSQGITHGAINKRAKRDGWERDLKAKVKAKADALVSKSLVSTQVSTDTKVAERLEVDANAQVIAGIRISHRTDIGRSRRLLNLLLDELEGLTEEQGTLKELIAQLKDEGEGGEGAEMSDVLALASKMSSLPSRTKTMKDMAETLKTLVAMERQAYDLENSGDEDPASASLTVSFVKPSNGN
jgi:hypothetical protein